MGGRGGGGGRASGFTTRCCLSAVRGFGRGRAGEGRQRKRCDTTGCRLLLRVFPGEGGPSSWLEIEKLSFFFVWRGVAFCARSVCVQ